VDLTIRILAGQPSEALITNRCDQTVAVLTSPLEVRVRRTGTEIFVHERMPRAAYAILYAVASDLGSSALRGDGVIRDGGLRVRRAPGYTSVGPRSTATVPVLCDLGLAAGDYAFAIATYEAPLLEAPGRSDPFDCAQSVQYWNAAGGDAPDVSISPHVRQILASAQSAPTPP
jgi:hypothetical protein